jgi:hypothetical protein
MASPRQIAANRRNAEKSTGPRTEEGKARCRGNALKHGMTGEGVVLPDDQAAAVAERREQWRDGFRPEGPEEEWLYEQLIVNSVRVDQCQAQEPAVRVYQARRAVLWWDEDRRLDAETLAAGLARRPALVALRLRQTAQGCDWLIERWRGLASALEAEASGGDWTDEQKSLAFDLLGVPAELRTAPPWADAGSPAALAAREIDELKALRNGPLDALDDAEREAAERGVPLNPASGRDLARLRRYEAACLRRFRWAWDRLRARRDDVPRPAVSGPTPSPVSPTQPRPRPRPKPDPEPTRTPTPVLSLAEPDGGPKTDAPVWRTPPRGSIALPVASTATLSPPPPPQKLNRRARRAALKFAGRR